MEIKKIINLKIGWIKMRRKLINLFTIAFILFSSVNFPKLVSSDTEELTLLSVEDITGAVQIHGSEVSVNGSPVSETNEVKVGDDVEFKFTWSINPMPEVEAGSYFTVTLPPSEFFHFPNSAFDFIIRDPITNEVIGTYKIIDGLVKVTLSEDGVNSERIVNGVFTAKGKAQKEGTSPGGGNGQGTPVEIKPNPIDPPIDPPDPPIDPPEPPGPIEKPEYPEEEQKFKKDGHQLGDQNAIVWSLKVNHTSLGELADKYKENGQVEGGYIQEKKDGILVDHLPPGVKFHEGSLWVTVPINALTADGKISSHGLGNGNIKVHGSFTKLTPNNGESYEDFYERVKNYPKEHNQRAYGVYEQANGRETFLASLGDTPGSNGFQYEDINEGIVSTLIDETTDLTDEEKENLKKLYGIGNENKAISPSKGAIVAYDIAFQVSVQGGTGEYVNEAEYFYGEDGKDETATHVDFVEIGGSAELEDLTYAILQKTDDETGEVLKGAKFKLYKDGEYIKTYTTNQYGKLQTDGLEAGQYELVEVEAPNGYLTDQTPIPFTVTAVSKPTFINLSMTNKNKYKFSATKVVKGSSNFTGEKLFEFEIRDSSDAAVAFGKVNISNKDTSHSIEFYKESTYNNRIKDSEWATILEDGKQYSLVETNTQGYKVSYSGGNINDDNQFLVSHTENPTDPVQSIQVAVTNKDSFDFKAYKEVKGSGNLTPAKTFEFELKEMAGSGNTVAYGKVLVGTKGQREIIEFYTQANYEPSTLITDWTTVLTEGNKYKLVETVNQFYNVDYSGGTGTDSNEFEVVYNNKAKDITINIVNSDTFDFNATKKVVGDGVFEKETFKFELLDSSNNVIAHGRAEVTDKNTEVPIIFYTDPEDSITKITDWTDVLSEGETYQLNEVDDSGYAVTYVNQAGEKTNQITVQFNTGQKLSVQVENKRDKVPLPETGGEGSRQQMIFASVFLAFIILVGGIIEYRRKAGA